MRFEIKDFLFDPDPATVKVGQKVAITNGDTAPHTVTEDGSSKAFDSGTIKGGQKGSVTFTKPGTFKYYCQFHATMKRHGHRHGLGRGRSHGDAAMRVRSARARGGGRLRRLA